MLNRMTENIRWKAMSENACVIVFTQANSELY